MTQAGSEPLGHGVGLLSQRAALLFDDPQLAFLKVADLRLQRRIPMIWPARRALSHVAARFMALCEAISSDPPEVRPIWTRVHEHSSRGDDDRGEMPAEVFDNLPPLAGVFIVVTLILRWLSAG